MQDIIVIIFSSLFGVVMGVVLSLLFWMGVDMLRAMFWKSRNRSIVFLFCGIGYRVRKRNQKIVVSILFYLKPRLKVRVKAVVYALYYGLLPSRFYEKVKHYNCSYLEHLFINTVYAIRWATFNEHERDVRFEARTNNNN